MNTEYILNGIKSNLESYVETELTAIQVEASSSVVAPTPQEYKLGEHDTDVLTTYPSILIWSPYSRKTNDYQGFQNREVWYRVLTWVVENDLENLHIFVTRYGDAVARVLRNESYLPIHLHDCVVEDINNTDIYQTDVAYAQGCVVEGTVNYILE